MKKEGLLKSTGKGAATRYTLARDSSVREVRPRQVRSKATAKGAAPPSGKTVGASMTAVGEKEPPTGAPLVERITATLAAAGEPLPMREIALRLNCPLDGKFRKALATLRSEGVVVMVGKWRGARYAVDDSR